jgi:hypothetical protein
MMRRPRLTYANVVSTLCLFLALGGGAWAAKTKLLPKNSVGTVQLKNGAVTGPKVQDGSLTGADVQASTLGTVPKAASAESATNAGHATSADSAGHAATAGHADDATSAGHATSADSATTAGDAATLDGAAASAFLAAGRVPHINYETHWETEPIAVRPILAFGPLTLSAFCVESQEGPPARTLMELEATGPTGSTIDFSRVTRTTTKVGVVGLEPANATLIAEPFTSTDTEALHISMMLVYRDAARTISIPLSLFVDEGDTCRIRGVGTVAE